MLAPSSMEKAMRTMTIGRLAKQAGVNIDTIRYYERNGLIPEPVRRESGYREYEGADLRRLRFILRAKDLGFTLAEIRELLTLSADRDVRGVKRRAEQHLEQVKHKIKELQRVRRGLKTLVDACPGHGDLERCPIVAALNGKDDR
jgi:MerR family copper efflux transcriptional regulator